jgi:EmrB/QacA subfamily drug resistance transporter
VSGGKGRQHYAVTFALLAVAVTSYSLLQSLVAPALPHLQEEFGVSASAASWIVTAYLLTAAVATPLIGRLGDMFGKARLFAITLAVLCAGTVVSAVASSLVVMVAGRGLQGAAGGLFPLAYGIIRDELPRRRVPGALGFVSGLVGIGAAVGLLLAGPIVDSLSYHYLFWLPLIPLLAVTIAVYFFFPESPIRVPARANWLGGFLMASGLAAILLGVSQTPTWGWWSAKTVTCLTVGALLLLLWVRSESRSSEPLIDMRMLRIRGVWTTNAVAFMSGFAMWASFILLPQFVQTPERLGYGFSASIAETALFLLPATLAMLVSGSLTGRVERLVGSKVALLAAVVLTGTAYLVLALERDQEPMFYVGSFLMGLGSGLLFGSMANLIVEAVDPGQTGAAMGMNFVTRTVGGAFGGAIIATMLSSSVGASGHPSARGFTLAFTTCSLAMASCFVIGLSVPRRRREATFETQLVGEAP